MKNVFVHDQVKIVIDAPESMTRGDMLGSMIQEILRAYVRENGIEATAQFWNSVQTIVTRIETQVAPKPAPASKPNRIYTWAVRRSRMFWFLAGMWLSGLIDMIDLLAQVLA